MVSAFTCSHKLWASLLGSLFFAAQVVRPWAGYDGGPSGERAIASSMAGPSLQGAALSGQFGPSVSIRCTLNPGGSSSGHPQPDRSASMGTSLGASRYPTPSGPTCACASELLLGRCSFSAVCESGGFLFPPSFSATVLHSCSWTPEYVQVAAYSPVHCLIRLRPGLLSVIRPPRWSEVGRRTSFRS